MTTTTRKPTAIRKPTAAAARGDWTVMSIPGRDEDDSATWFAYGRSARNSVACDSHDDAAAHCRAMNRA